MAAPTRAQLKLTFDDGTFIDAFTDATLRDAFTDPIGHVQVTAKTATSSQYADYRTKLGKGNQIHVYINGAHQGRFLIQDAERVTGPEGRSIQITCYTPLITPYEGAVDPDLSLQHLSDVSIENAVKTVLVPYGFTKTPIADARSHVNALTGVPLPGGQPPPFAFGDLKMKNAVAHDGETAYQFIARIITRLGACLRISQDDTPLIGVPNYTQDNAYTVVLSSTPGTYPDADRFFGPVRIRETNAGQFVQTAVIGMRRLGAGDPNVARPKAVVNASDVIPARSQYRSSVAPFKPLSYKDKSSRDANQAQNAAIFEIGMRAKDAYVVDGTVDGWISKTGRVWTVDTMARVVVEPEGLDDPMYLLEREFFVDPNRGQMTRLKFIPKGALILGEKPTKGGH